MTENFRKTIRSFLDGESPATREEALQLLHEWFGRYSPDPALLTEEVNRFFASAGGGTGGDSVLSSLVVSA